MSSVCTAVIVAAGKGKRMGTEISKQFLPLGGREILTHSVEKFERAEHIRDIILVTGEDSLQDVRDMKTEYGWKKVVSVVAGGKERQDSVWNGLQAVSDDTDIILIHDGVRPFVTEEILIRSIETALEMGGCVAGVPAKDTIKVCDGVSLIAVVGRRMASNSGVSGMIFGTLGKIGVNIRMIEQGSDEINIIIGVMDSDFKTTIRTLYDSFT